MLNTENYILSDLALPVWHQEEHLTCGKHQEGHMARLLACGKPATALSEVLVWRPMGNLA